MRHDDDRAVDRFALAMRCKLRDKRLEGKYGWDDPFTCSIGDLKRMLARHVKKGDPIDIANFCMMIWNRERAESNRKEDERG